jgi:hypothetical protein
VQLAQEQRGPWHASYLDVLATPGYAAEIAKKHAAATKRKRNPVPAVERAARLYERFTGHKGQVVARITKPRYPDAVTVIGECDGVLYTTVRDGEIESYIHRFKSKARPLLCVDQDGKTLYLLGGAYRFTDRGIIDDE